MGLQSVCIVVALIALLAAGCLQASASERASKSCEELCLQAVEAGLNLSEGPCLGVLLEQGLENWVCDVSHQPRTPADNMPYNQCSAFLRGEATHFVEVNENCSVFRTQ